MVVNTPFPPPQVQKPFSDRAEEAPPVFALIVPVWGKHHTDLFTRYCLPSLLTPGNLGALKKKGGKLFIVSTQADLEMIRSQESYSRAANTVPVIEIEVDGRVDLSNTHRAMTECYALALRTLPPQHTVSIFLTPDCVVSRNSLERTIDIVSSGYRAVMVCGLRLNLDTAGPTLDHMFHNGAEASAIEETRLCDVALRNLHPISQSCDVNSAAFCDQWPSHLYWIDPDKKWLVAHCFHLHPLAVFGIPNIIDAQTTIDGDYLKALDLKSHEIYVCHNSDEISCFELSPGKKSFGMEAGRFTERALVRFAERHCNDLHIDFFPKPIVFRSFDKPIIPPSVVRQANRYFSVVAKGSLREAAVYLAIRSIKQQPFLDRTIGSLARRLRRTLRQLRSRR